MKRILLLLSFCFLLLPMLHAQKVGLVLSGGGAKGMTHIGIIRALEENNIPIDYITGTSMGAIIGSLYAMGYYIFFFCYLIDWDIVFFQSPNDADMRHTFRTTTTQYKSNFLGMQHGQQQETKR